MRNKLKKKATEGQGQMFHIYEKFSFFRAKTGPKMN